MEKQAQLVGRGPGAGSAIGGEVGVPGLDVILRLASPAIDLLVEPAGRLAERMTAVMNRRSRSNTTMGWNPYSS